MFVSKYIKKYFNDRLLLFLLLHNTQEQENGERNDGLKLQFREANTRENEYATFAFH